MLLLNYYSDLIVCNNNVTLNIISDRGNKMIASQFHPVRLLLCRLVKILAFLIQTRQIRGEHRWDEGWLCKRDQRGLLTITCWGYPALGNTFTTLMKQKQTSLSFSHLLSASCQLSNNVCVCVFAQGCTYHRHISPFLISTRESWGQSEVRLMRVGVSGSGEVGVR